MSRATDVIVVPVSDLPAAKAVYTALLGEGPDQDAPYYVGFSHSKVGLDPNGHSHGMTGPVVFWIVEDIAASVDAIVAAGGSIREPSRDVGGGKLVATVTDADGNAIGLSQNP